MIWITWLLGVVLSLVGQLLSASASTCDSHDHCHTEQSALYKALVGFIYRILEKRKPHECFEACHADLICQSFNYVLLKEKCELNNRTKEAKPGHYLTDKDRFYVKLIINRGIYTVNRYNRLVIRPVLKLRHTVSWRSWLVLTGFWLVLVLSPSNKILWNIILKDHIFLPIKTKHWLFESELYNFLPYGRQRRSVAEWFGARLVLYKSGGSGFSPPPCH